VLSTASNEVALKKNKPIAVGDILESLKKTTALGKHLEYAQIWEHWEEIAGKQLARHTRPHDVRDGQLRIAAESSVWMNKITYKKWTIIKRVNQLAKKELINDLFVLLLDDNDSL